MNAVKKTVFIGNMANVAGETLSFPAALAEVLNAYKFMDILINLKTLTGTSPTMKYSVQESFSDNSGADLFVETAVTSALAATGKVFVTHEDSGHSGDVAKNAMLGKGFKKQIVSTPGGTVGSVSADIYAVFWNPGT